MAICAPARDCEAVWMLMGREGLKPYFNLNWVQVLFTGQQRHLKNKNIKRRELVFAVRCNYLYKSVKKWLNKNNSTEKKQKIKLLQRGVQVEQAVSLPDRNWQITRGALFHPLGMSLHCIKHIFLQSLIQQDTYSHFCSNTQRTLALPSVTGRLMRQLCINMSSGKSPAI